MDAYFIFSLDISALSGCEQILWPALFKNRSAVDLRDQAFRSFFESTDSDPVEGEVKAWMDEARSKNGKAIWKDAFLKEESPYRIQIDTSLPNTNSHLWVPGNVMSNVPKNSYSQCQFSGHKMHIYREGVITYSVEYALLAKSNSDASEALLDVPHVIDCLNRLQTTSWIAFKLVVERWLNSGQVKSLLNDAFQTDDALLDCISLAPDEFMRKSRTHKLLVLDRMLRYEPSSGTSPAKLTDVDPDQALSSPEIAGMLNTATWYEDYHPKYLKELAEKNIGYRKDEIYLTDKKASLISNPGFWDEADSLSIYRNDIRLAVEYWLAKLVQCQTMLGYLQFDPVIRNISRTDPDKALEPVIVAQRAVARLQESLDPSRLIDHGFTTLFMHRLRAELGIDSPLSFIQERVDDAATSIQLRASVNADSAIAVEALDYSKRNYRVAIYVGIIVVIVTIGMGALAILLG